ncbi:14284_t:CDS:1, partial [Gigaspora margarita]
TIYKSESICLDISEKIEGWLFINDTNYEDYPVYNTLKNIINSSERDKTSKIRKIDYPNYIF